MPIHDVGYRRWERAVGSPFLRWTVIAGAGMRLVWKNHWLRRMLFLAWLPAAGLGIAIFVYEQSFERRELREAVPVLLGQLPQSDVAIAAWRLAMAKSVQAPGSEAGVETLLGSKKRRPWPVIACGRCC